MPKHIVGSPDPSTANDSRLEIEPSQETRLLEQAKAVGISSDEIGAFYVILASDLPANIDKDGYDLLSENELREESQKNRGWFYDEDNRRLIGTVPPATTIIRRMRTAK